MWTPVLIKLQQTLLRYSTFDAVSTNCTSWLLLDNRYYRQTLVTFFASRAPFSQMFLISIDMPNSHSFVLETGCYQLIAPNVRVLLDAQPQLLSLSKSKFSSLVDHWGAYYLSPTTMLWLEHVTARCRIHPCSIDNGGGDHDAILVLGPFRNTLHRKQFLDLFDTERQPFYPRSDTVTIRVIPTKY